MTEKIRAFFCFAIIFLIFPFKGKGQSDTSLDKHLVIIENKIIDKKFDLANNELDQLLKNNESNKLNTVKILSYKTLLYTTQNDPVKALEYCTLSKQISNKTTSKLDDAYTFKSYAIMYVASQSNASAVVEANRALVILKNYPNESLLMSDIYNLLCKMHTQTGTFLGEYGEYAKLALEYGEKSGYISKILYGHSSMTMTNILKYINNKSTKDLVTAFYHLDKSLHILSLNERSEEVSFTAKVILFNNYASLINQYPYKDYPQNKRTQIAYGYIERAEKIAKENHLDHLLGTCYSTYAEIFESKGNSLKAEEYFMKAYNQDKDSKDPNKNIFKYVLDKLYSLNKKQGKIDKALFFHEELLKYSKESFDKQLDSKRKFLEAYYSSEERKNQIEQLEISNHDYRKNRLLYIGIALLSVIGLVLMGYAFRNRQRLNLNKTELLEAAKNEAELKLQLESEEKARFKAEQELLAFQQEHLQKQALATTLQLEQKKIFINDLKDKIKDNKDINLDKILKEEKAKDKEFSEIQGIIQDVHPHFFRRLTEESKSKLTNQDLKYAAYILMKLDNTQIANMMKVEPKTVRMTKYRLKQKIGIDKDADLNTFIQQLGA